MSTNAVSKDALMDEKLKNDFFSIEGKKRRKAGIRRFFCVMLILTIFASVLNWGVITQWGDVKIERLTLSSHDGQSASAVLYKPASATAETPAPFLLCTHGNAGNARNHESWAVEFARRGFVVISIDHLGAGDSDNYVHDSNTSTQSLTSVAEVFYQHALALDYVDHDNMLVGGHSMGCGTASAIAAKYNAKGMLLASGDYGAFLLMVIDGNYPIGAEAYAEALASYTGNVLWVYGDVEAKAPQLPETVQAYMDSRPCYAGQTYTEIGQVGGSFAEGNAVCALVDEKRIHEAAFVNAGTIENLLWFAQETVGVDNVPHYIDPADQVWQWKDYVGLFGIHIFGLLICAIALLLIEEVPAFEIVKRPIPRNIGLRGPGLAISIALGVIFAWVVLKTGAFGIIAATGLTNPTKNALPKAGFRLMFANVAYGVIIGLNLLGLLGFLFYYFTEGRKHKLTCSDLGLTPTGSERIQLKMIARSLLVAMLTIAFAWGYLQLQDAVFGTDFYAWFFGFKNLALNKLSYYPTYIITWILCFVVASFGINVERRLPSTGREGLDTVIAMVFNICVAEFTLILGIVVNWCFESNGMTVPWLFTFGADIARLWGMPTGMAIGIGGSTLLFRKTGNTWLCALLMGTVAALMCVMFGQVRVFC